jgi:HNH endonuclease
MDSHTRVLVRQRAARCCEYCRLPETADPYNTFHLEHVIAKQHGGDDDESNLAWACSRCNHRKGTNLASRDPESGAIVEVFHPRRQKWSDHFGLRDGRIVGSSPTGRATVRLLDMNEGRRVRLRRELMELGEYLLL